MDMFDLMIAFLFTLGITLLILYYKKFDNDIILIISIVLIISSLYFIVQKISGGLRKKDGFRS